MIGGGQIEGVEVVRVEHGGDHDDQFPVRVAVRDASLGDLLTQSKEFGGLDLGASKTSLLFFAVILILVVREKTLAIRHGVAGKGDGPLGGRRPDYAWAVAGVAVVAVVGLGLSSLGSSQSDVTALTVADPGGAGTALQPGTGNGPAAPAAKQPHPITRLGNLTRFAAITRDVHNLVASNDLAGGKARVKDLEVSWDDAEAGLKPRDPGKWHQLDDEIGAVLTSLRASNPSQADCTAKLKTLMGTLNHLDGI